MLAQEAKVLGIVECVEIGRIAVELADVKLHGARILFTAIDQQLFLVALGFERHAGQFHEEGDRDGGGERVNEQQRETGFRVALFRVSAPVHTAGSSWMRTVWLLLNCVSSMVMEVSPMATTL